MVTVDGRTAEVPVGTTILSAARQMGVSIPTLCNYKGLSTYGACRVCLVEIERGQGRQLVASCSYPAESGLVVHTETETVKDSRRLVLELLLAQAPDSPELAAFTSARHNRCYSRDSCLRVRLSVFCDLSGSAGTPVGRHLRVRRTALCRRGRSAGCSGPPTRRA